MKKLLAMLALLTVACGSPENSFDLNVEGDFLEYTMMVEFIDVSNPEKVMEDVEVSIEGKDADAIVEIAGKKTFTVTNGRLVLGLDPRYKPDEKEALRFKIKASAPGYLPVSSAAYFRHGEKEQLSTVNMINLNSPPEGVTETSSTVNLSGSILGLDLAINLSPTGTKETGVDLEIPGQTKFLSSMGAELSGADLTVQLTHFDSDNDLSLNAFPGGFMPETVIGPSGMEEEVFFNTAGFAIIDMEVNGTHVAEMSKEMEVKMKLDPTVKNLNSNNNIQEGDSIPVWSYNVEAGTWIFEKQAYINETNGDMYATFYTKKPSWFNLGFYGSKCYGNFDNGSISFSIPGGSSRGEFLLCDVVFAYNGKSISHWSTKSEYLYDGRSITLYNAPATSCKIRIYEGTTWYNKGEMIAESQPFEPCSGNTVVTLPSDVFSEEVSIDLEVSCPSNADFVLRPNFYLYYKEPSLENYHYLTYVQKGKGQTTKLEIGETYDFRVYYNGTYFDFSEIIKDKNIFHLDLDSEACSTFFN